MGGRGSMGIMIGGDFGGKGPAQRPGLNGCEVLGLGVGWFAWGRRGATIGRRLRLGRKE
jgi:hypothetical protein